MSSMTWQDAIEEYLRDQQLAGRLNGEETIRKYERALARHAEDTPDGPLGVSRGDIKRTLARWEHPNTRALEHSVLVAFFDWMLTEGYREDNPARQVARAKKRKQSVTRLTRREVQAMIAACETTRERRVILLGVCAGARVSELRAFQGRHFEREGFVWFSADIAKGKSEGWVPVLPELEPIVRDIRATVPLDQYVIPAYYGGGLALRAPTCMAGRDALVRIIREVAKRAGIATRIYPHLLRHAFGDHIARHAGLRVAQALMRHASVSTTANVYVDRPDLDEIAAKAQGLRFGEPQTHADPVKPPEVLVQARAAAPSRPVRSLAELEAAIGGRSIAPEVIQQLALVGRAHAEGAELEAITTLDVAALAGGGA